MTAGKRMVTALGIAVAALAALLGCSEDNTATGGSGGSGVSVCATCQQVVDSDGAPNAICRGASEDALAALNTCVCGSGIAMGVGGAGGAGGAGGSAPTDCRAVCLDNACQVTQPSDDCLSCIESTCMTQLADCRAN